MSIEAICIPLEEAIIDYAKAWNLAPLSDLRTELFEVYALGITPFHFTIEPPPTLRTILQMLGTHTIPALHIYGNGEGFYDVTKHEPFLLVGSEDVLHSFEEIKWAIKETAEAFGGRIEVVTDALLCVKLPDDETMPHENFAQVIITKLEELGIFIDHETLIGDAAQIAFRFYDKTTLMLLSPTGVSDVDALSTWSSETRIALTDIAMICTDDTSPELVPLIGYPMCLANSLDIVSEVKAHDGYVSPLPMIEGVIDCLRHLKEQRMRR